MCERSSTPCRTLGVPYILVCTLGMWQSLYHSIAYELGIKKYDKSTYSTISFIGVTHTHRWSRSYRIIEFPFFLYSCIVLSRKNLWVFLNNFFIERWLLEEWTPEGWKREGRMRKFLIEYSKLSKFFKSLFRGEVNEVLVLPPEWLNGRQETLYFL